MCCSSLSFFYVFFIVLLVQPFYIFSPLSQLRCDIGDCPLHPLLPHFFLVIPRRVFIEATRASIFRSLRLLFTSLTFPVHLYAVVSSHPDPPLPSWPPGLSLPPSPHLGPATLVFLFSLPTVLLACSRIAPCSFSLDGPGIFRTPSFFIFSSFLDPFLRSYFGALFHSMLLLVRDLQDLTCRPLCHLHSTDTLTTLHLSLLFGLSCAYPPCCYTHLLVAHTPGLLRALFFLSHVFLFSLCSSLSPDRCTLHHSPFLHAGSNACSFTYLCSTCLIAHSFIRRCLPLCHRLGSTTVYSRFPHTSLPCWLAFAMVLGSRPPVWTLES